jgi:hypothetical protein
MPLIRLDQLQQFAAINILSDPGMIGGPIVIPNCVQVVLNWTLADGKVGHNVMYGRAAGVPAPTPAQADLIFDALSTGAQWTALAAVLSTSTSFTGLTLRSVHTANNPLVASTHAAKAGADATQALPNEMAACLTLRTAATGPSNRGRMYIPGFSVATVTAANVLSAAAVTALTNWAGTIIGAFAAGSLTLVIGQPARQAYTGSTGTLHPARTANSVTVSSVILRNNTWDSQRRRGLK